MNGISVAGRRTCYIGLILSLVHWPASHRFFTRRVVPPCFDRTAAEQAAVMEVVAEVKRLPDKQLDSEPAGSVTSSVNH